MLKQHVECNMFEEQLNKRRRLLSEAPWRIKKHGFNVRIIIDDGQKKKRTNKIRRVAVHRRGQSTKLTRDRGICEQRGQQRDIHFNEKLLAADLWFNCQKKLRAWLILGGRIIVKSVVRSTGSNQKLLYAVFWHHKTGEYFQAATVGFTNECVRRTCAVGALLRQCKPLGRLPVRRRWTTT